MRKRILMFDYNTPNGVTRLLATQIVYYILTPRSGVFKPVTFISITYRRPASFRNSSLSYRCHQSEQNNAKVKCV